MKAFHLCQLSIQIHRFTFAVLAEIGSRWRMEVEALKVSHLDPEIGMNLGRVAQIQAARSAARW